MPDTIADQGDRFASLERKLRLLRRTIKGVADAGRKAVEDPGSRPEFQAAFDVAQTEWAEFKKIWEDLDAAATASSVSFPTTSWLAVYDELVQEIISAKASVLRIQRLEKVEEPPQQRDLAQLMSTLGAHTGKPALPKIPIPQFSGDLWKWTHFRDAFTSLVHEEPSLSDIERLHYLLGAVKGEAASHISHLPVEDRSYNLAWEKLKITYDNKRILAALFVQRLVDCNARDFSDERRRYECFLTEVADSIQAFRNIGLDDPCDFLLASLALRCLDSKTRRQFELTLNADEVPKADEVVSFVRKRMNALTISAGMHPSESRSSPSKFSQQSSKGPRYPSRSSPKYSAVALHAVQPSKNRSHAGSTTVRSDKQREPKIIDYNQTRSAADNKPCPFCRQPHSLLYCFKFLSLSPFKRKEFAQGWKGCNNCLREDHRTTACTSRFNCRYCQQRHHSLLHLEEASPMDASPSKISESCSKAPQEFVGFGYAPPHTLQSTVLLGTLTTFLKDSKGRFHRIRAVLDSGSQRTFITNALAQRLEAPISKFVGSITGLGESNVTQPSGLTSCIIVPRNDSKQYKAECVVVPNISSELPTSRLDRELVLRLQQPNLADHKFSLPAPVDMLIGADIYSSLVVGAPRPSGVGELFYLPTVCGDVIIGRLNHPPKDPEGIHSFFTECKQTIDEQLRAFWEVEEPCPVNRRDPLDMVCEDHFVCTHTRTPEGRYMVRLPVRNDHQPLGSNREVASRRFYSLERKFARDPKLSESYHAFMEEYSSMLHMSPAEHPAGYVIPHHAVWQQRPEGSKLRTVFDGSCPSSTSTCLNDIFFSGPKLQSDLPSILIRFRLYRIPLCADIVKMYRQVLVHPLDRHLQHIFWRNSPGDELKEYTLNTVTYGLKPSAFLAMRAIRQLLKDEGGAFPLAASRVESSMYVDDLVTGADSIEEFKTLHSQLCALFTKGCFPLGKWASIASAAVHLEENHKQARVEFNSEDGCIKILGLVWKPDEDTFSFAIHPPVMRPVTKRILLSSISRIFDPLGFLSPVILLAKILIQDVWKLGIGWDEELPSNIAEGWHNLASGWAELAAISLPRYATSVGATWRLVGFCDASMKGYAAAVYLVSGNPDGSTTSALLKSKTKVAPLKYLSVARLELCGALLLVRLMSSIDLPAAAPQPPIFLTDSEVVLAWLRKPSHSLKTFEANRVSSILEGSSVASWHHVSSEDNPADIASRGTLPGRLRACDLWWCGPLWLCEPEPTWQIHNNYQTLMTSENPSDVRKASSLVSDEWMKKFSSFSKLVNVTAWMLKFYKRIRGISPATAFINSEEFEEALMALVRNTQQANYPEKFTSGNETPKGLQELSPFVDERGIIRVGGRLHNSSIPHSAKHPVLLPRSSHLSKIVTEDYHAKHFHAGPTLTLALLRGRFWIPGGLKYVRSRLTKCVPCRLRKSRPANPLMAPLPKERVTQSRAFLIVGVDFAGPFSIKESNRRNAALGKAYLCLFICFATKAVHLEAVSSLSTASFLAALDRFLARRGLPQQIWSDNGSNFIGASRFIKDVWMSISKGQDEITRALVPKGISWNFNPPRAPSFGGLWEAGVKSVKTLLPGIIGRQAYTFEELATAFNKIEGLLNSRPLCSLSEDPTVCDFLTPGHFLIGAPLTSIPEQAPSSVTSAQYRSRWESLMAQVNCVWERWRREYLHTLQQRGKWRKKSRGFQVGDLAILVEKRSLVGQWPVCRVTKVHPGGDHIVRVVTVQTPSGSQFIRASSSLAPLFFEEEPDAEVGVEQTEE